MHITVHAVPLGTDIHCSNVLLFGERSGSLGVVEEGRNSRLKKRVRWVKLLAIFKEITH